MVKKILDTSCKIHVSFQHIPRKSCTSATCSRPHSCVLVKNAHLPHLFNSDMMHPHTWAGLHGGPFQSLIKFCLHPHELLNLYCSSPFLIRPSDLYTDKQVPLPVGEGDPIFFILFCISMIIPTLELLSWLCIFILHLPPFIVAYLHGTHKLI